MTSGTVSSLFFLLLSCTPAFAQQQAQFNQVLNLNGDMDLNSFIFPDRSKVETFSQKQQQLIVNQQTPAVPPNQVSGSTGQPFVALMAQSMTISTNNANDLVGGQIELAMDPQMLASAAVNPDNTFVAMLSPDRQTWMIQETMRSVNITDMTVRMIKRNNIDGEYMALGRQTVETNAFLTNFGSDAASVVAIQGTGLQENEFMDGFRMSIRATQPMQMTVDVVDGVENGMLSALQGQEAVNDFRYKVVTNLAAVQPDLNQQVTVVQMPINALRLQSMMQAMGVPQNGQVALAVAQRGVLQNPGGATGSLGALGTGQRLTRSEFRRSIKERQVQGGTGTTGNQPVAQTLLLAPTFTPIQAEAVIDPLNMRIAIPVRQIDGEFILTMQMMGAAGEAPPAPQAGQAPTPPPTEAQTPPPAEAQAPPPTPESPGAATPETPSAGGTNGTAPAEGGAKPAEGEAKPAEGEAKPAEGEAKPAEGEAKPAEGEAKPAEGEAKPERRQESAGELKAPAGAILITMKEVNKMVELVQWGGQAPISQMMTNYQKSQNGTL